MLPSRCFYLDLSIAFISFSYKQTVIPFPRLVFSPGLTIQALYLCKESGFDLFAFDIA